MSSGLCYSWGRGRKTENADTVINVLVPPRRGQKTKLNKVVVNVGTTAHTLTVLRPCANTTLSAAATAGQAVINLTADPGNYSGSVADNLIAANDYLAIEKPDGTYHLGVVQSVSTLAITLTSNVPTGGFSSGAKVWFFGVAADTDPNTGEAHSVFTLPASTYAVIVGANGSSVVETKNNYEPLLLQVNNATAASTVESASGTYGP